VSGVKKIFSRREKPEKQEIEREKEREKNIYLVAYAAERSLKEAVTV
jgi:hypothetical protein